MKIGGSAIVSTDVLDDCGLEFESVQTLNHWHGQAVEKDTAKVVFQTGPCGSWIEAYKQVVEHVTQHQWKERLRGQGRNVP